MTVSATGRSTPPPYPSQETESATLFLELPFDPTDSSQAASPEPASSEFRILSQELPFYSTDFSKEASPEPASLVTYPLPPSAGAEAERAEAAGGNKEHSLSTVVTETSSMTATQRSISDSVIELHELRSAHRRACEEGREKEAVELRHKIQTSTSALDEINAQVPALTARDLDMVGTVLFQNPVESTFEKDGCVYASGNHSELFRWATSSFADWGYVGCSVFHQEKAASPKVLNHINKLTSSLLNPESSYRSAYASISLKKPLLQQSHETRGPLTQFVYDLGSYLHVVEDKTPLLEEIQAHQETAKTVILDKFAKRAIELNYVGAIFVDNPDLLKILGWSDQHASAYHLIILPCKFLSFSQHNV